MFLDLFILLFFGNISRSQTCRQILTCDDSNDAQSPKSVPFEG